MTAAPDITLSEVIDTERTPWEKHEDIWLKRDDLYEQAGVRGGKVRTCWHLATSGREAGDHTLVTAGARSSPQVNIVAHVARELGMGCIAYCPRGKLTPELEAAENAGAEIRRCAAGYNSVIRAAARTHCEAEAGCTHIPFGMECGEAVRRTAGQVLGLPTGINTLHVPVGSGMSLAGILHGLELLERDRQPRHIVGVCVGADPDRRLDAWAPALWRFEAQLVRSRHAYDQHVAAQLDGVLLDPVYEAKVKELLLPGDALWVVGVRQTL